MKPMCNSKDTPDLGINSRYDTNGMAACRLAQFGGQRTSPSNPRGRLHRQKDVSLTHVKQAVIWCIDWFVCFLPVFGPWLVAQNDQSMPPAIAPGHILCTCLSIMKLVEKVIYSHTPQREGLISSQSSRGNTPLTFGRCGNT